MKRGVVYAGMAGAIWGGVILAPSLVPEFNPLLISSVRFALYGAISLLIALPVALGLLRRVSREDLSMLVRLSLAGNLLYFALLSAAVQFAGVAAASLINGIMPLAIAYQSRSEHDSLPLSRMKLPLALVALGILCINLDPSAQVTVFHAVLLRRHRARQIRGGRRPVRWRPWASRNRKPGG